MEVTVQPDPSFLLVSLDITIPPTGVYDAPDAEVFEPSIEAGKDQGRPPCIFAFFEQWRRGRTLVLDRDDFRCCGGAARSLMGIGTRARGEFLHFLAVEEGLKESEELMGRWIDSNPGYRPANRRIFIGPLKPIAYEHLRTVTFWVNADQLSALTLGAQYRSEPEDPPPVITRFGAGCGQMINVFDSLDIVQAQAGTTDIAMRQWVPRDVLAFTVTKPMFELLCGFDDTSYLNKPFLKHLKKARGGTL